MLSPPTLADFLEYFFCSRRLNKRVWSALSLCRSVCHKSTIQSAHFMWPSPLVFAHWTLLPPRLPATVNLLARIYQLNGIKWKCVHTFYERKTKLSHEPPREISTFSRSDAIRENRILSLVTCKQRINNNVANVDFLSGAFMFAADSSSSRTHFDKLNYQGNWMAKRERLPYGTNIDFAIKLSECIWSRLYVRDYFRLATAAVAMRKRSSELWRTANVGLGNQNVQTIETKKV